MSDWKKRLRESKVVSRAKFYAQGHSDGSDWAMQTAEFVELERLDELMQTRTSSFFSANSGHAYSVAEPGQSSVGRLV